MCSAVKSQPKHECRFEFSSWCCAALNTNVIVWNIKNIIQLFFFVFWKLHSKSSWLKKHDASGFPSEIQWYKNTCAGFWFLNVLCSCLFNEVKAFWEIYLWQSVLILWRAATNKSIYGKHWYRLLYISENILKKSTK